MERHQEFMNATENKAKIRTHIVEKFPLAKKRNIQEQDSLLETGVIDSLGVLDLVHYLEAEFGFQVSDDELLPENFESVNSIAAFVASKTTTKAE
jgi:acyl carrier protein